MATGAGAGRRVEKRSPVAAPQEAGTADAASQNVAQKSVRNAGEKKTLTIREVPLTDLVCVQSCFYGGLIYVSKKSGDMVEWNEFGTEQYMSVQELMYMRNTQPDFFKKQWIRLIGENADDVFDFLHLERYCKTPINFQNFDDIFELPADEIEQTVSAFTPSMKESFARFSMEHIQNGTLDSLAVIRAIESATGFELRK